MWCDNNVAGGLFITLELLTIIVGKPYQYIISAYQVVVLCSHVKFPHYGMLVNRIAGKNACKMLCWVGQVASTEAGHITSNAMI